MVKVGITMPFEELALGAVTARVLLVLGALDVLFALVATGALVVVVGSPSGEVLREILQTSAAAHGIKLLLWMAYAASALQPLERWRRGEAEGDLAEPLSAAFRFPLRFALVFAGAWGLCHAVQLGMAFHARPAASALMPTAGAMLTLAVMLASFPFVLLWAEHLTTPLRGRLSLLALERGVVIAGRGLPLRHRMPLLALCLTLAPTTWLLAMGATLAPGPSEQVWMHGVVFLLAVVLWAPMVAWLMVKTVATPVATIADAVGRLSRETDLTRVPRVPVLYRDEIGELAEGVHEMMQRLAEELRRAEGAVRARDEFLAVAAHELRTPLTALQLQLESLNLLAARVEPTMLPPRFAERMDTARRQGERLVELTESLLDASRIKNGLALKLADVDLSALVRQAAAQHAETLQRAGCALTLAVPDGVHARCDPLRLEQVLNNIVGNAARYAAGAPVHIQLRAGDAQVELEVKDGGQGIRTEDQERIFHKFERANSGSHFGGLGIGLFLVRSVVEAHGGSIRVASAPGEGASFTVVLPRTTDGQR